ncbi:MAG TPA: hypothetical protein VJB64_03330 [Patescibacteria group bacterium]|nr:hypothetical protein [Patescibacteria group bacterium]
MNPHLLTLAALSVMVMPSYAGEQDDTCPPCPCKVTAQPTLSVTVSSSTDPTLVHALSDALEPAKATLKGQTCAPTYMGGVPIAIGWTLSTVPDGWKVEPNMGINLSTENATRARNLSGIILAQVAGVGPSGSHDTATVVVYCNKKQK